MATLKQGEIATLISGSPRMAVESVNEDQISVVWCNEGVVHRDTFSEVLLKKWEAREDDRGGRPQGKGGRDDRGGRGGRDDRGGPRGGDRGGDRGDKGKTGWHGKPREKSHFRKD